MLNIQFFFSLILIIYNLVVLKLKKNLIYIYVPTKILKYIDAKFVFIT